MSLVDQIHRVDLIKKQNQIEHLTKNIIEKYNKDHLKSTHQISILFSYKTKMSY
jgi:hypothetical protein